MSTTFNQRPQPSRQRSLILFSLGVIKSLATRSAFLFLVTLGTVAGQSIPAADVEKLLLRLEDEWAQVDVTQDKAVFQRILAPDFVSTSRSGKILSGRDAYLADWEYEGVRSARNSDMTVHVYSDDVAVVTGIDSTSGTNSDGSQWVHQDRFTDTWVKRNGTWQCVAEHVTRIK